MKKKRFKRDFDYWIDEYMYKCRSRKLRPKTMISYEQTLRLFERWCLEEANITEPSGYDIALVQRLLQHSSAATTQRYIGIEPQKIEEAIQGHAMLL